MFRLRGVFIFIAWFYLSEICLPIKSKSIAWRTRLLLIARKRKLGKASTEEKLVLTVFILAAFLGLRGLSCYPISFDGIK